MPVAPVAFGVQMKIFRRKNAPIIFPIVFFVSIIFLGSIILHFSEQSNESALSWIDSIFTATSAACVTGLVVVDTGSYFSMLGKTVILCLMQVGGLGIMTFTSLSIYLWRRRTSITDRIAIGQALSYETGFNLGRFLVEIVCWTFFIEICGAALLMLFAPGNFTVFSAIFHSVSAFCNAGFSLFSTSLVGLKGDWGVNLVFIILIFSGGIGFSVFIDIKNSIRKKFWKSMAAYKKGLNWYTRTVLHTSLFLILYGWLALYIAEYVSYNRIIPMDDAVLTSLFQSVTARTAGFNSLDIGSLTNVSLVVLLFLMFIGGAPGSCAGGIKVTTFRVLVATIWSQLRGRKQVVIGKYAVSQTDVKKSMVLFLLAISIIFTAVFLLDFTEGGDLPHYQVRGQFLEILFEAVSAFCTVGLSTGLTSILSVAGKWIIILLMLIGRLGPFVLITALQSIQEDQMYRLPEEKVMIG